MPKPSMLEQTAYHEAGHVIAALNLLVSIKYVTIKEEFDALGHIKYARRSDVGLTRKQLEAVQYSLNDSAYAVARLRLENGVIISYAGHIAQKKFVGKRIPKLGSFSDDEKATDVITLICADWEKESYHYSNWLFTRAVNLIENRWHEVEVVAKALLEKVTLSGKEINDEIFKALTEMRRAKMENDHA